MSDQQETKPEFDVCGHCRTPINMSENHFSLRFEGPEARVWKRFCSQQCLGFWVHNNLPTIQRRRPK